jgi:hypothetical protein
MSDPRSTKLARGWDLLADEAVQGLTDVERAELETILAEASELSSERETLALAAAAADEAFAGPATERLPASLASKVLIQARSGGAGRAEAVVGRIAPAPAREAAARSDGSTRPSPWLGRLGWLAAAVILLASLPTWLAPAPKPASTPAAAGPKALADELSALEASAKDLVRLPWAEGPDATGKGVKGEVVWSPSLQKGFMVFSGMAANDPRVEQYQLWIFDKDRDERFPVHGGVFDIAGGAERTIVRIEPRLGVPKAFQFVVTVERPGGVWVSDRSRIPALAKITGS